MKKPVADWLFLAESDLRTAKIAVKDEYPLTNIVTFHCQQAIEKYLKAYLIENEVSLIKTHDLVKLNDLINEIKNLGIDENKLLIINEVYIETRYPGEFGLLPGGIPTYEQAKEFIEYAEEIKSVISNALT